MSLPATSMAPAGQFLGEEGTSSVWVSPVSAEANWSHCETELVRGVSVVEHGQVPQRQQGQLLAGEVEDGVGDGGVVVQLKRAQGQLSGTKTLVWWPEGPSWSTRCPPCCSGCSLVHPMARSPSPASPGRWPPPRHPETPHPLPYPSLGPRKRMLSISIPIPLQEVDAPHPHPTMGSLVRQVYPKP